MGLREDLRKEAEETFDLSYGDEFKLFLAWRVLKRKGFPVVLTFVKNFFYDETAFIRYMRAFFAALGMALHAGIIPVFNGPKSWWIGPVLLVMAFMFGAGDKNRTPEEIKAISHARA